MERVQDCARNKGFGDFVRGCDKRYIKRKSMPDIISKTELKNMRIENQKANEFNRVATDSRRKAQVKNLPFVSQDVRTEIYNDLFTDGVIIQYPHGKVMQFGQKPFYYRGQIKDYGFCKSSLYRKICNDDELTKKTKVFANQLRLYEFKELIFNFEQVNKWPFGDVFTYAIAQHYGFETSIIDITNDLEVALFFACCKHIGDNKYQPLCERDIKNENGRYGVLFIRNQLCDMYEAIENEGFITVYPIGFQPFTRCHRQKGFFVNTQIDDDLQKSEKFKKCFFERSIELCQEVYNKFDGGNELFTYDALDEMKDMIDSIKTATSFSEKIFFAVYEEKNDGISESDWIEMLRTILGVKIGRSSYKLSRQRKRAINRKWSVDRFVEQEKIAPGFRMAYIP